MYFLDLLGTLAFAIGGAYKARSKKLNIFGVIFLGAITAVGGGTFRDLIIGRTPLFYLRDRNYLAVCLIAGLATYLLPAFFKKRYSVFRLIDSIGLATFVIIGVSISFNHLFTNLHFPNIISALACIFLGMLTGVGGGVLRDAIMGDTPFALKNGSNYVSSAFWGATLFYFLMFFNNLLAVLVSMAATLILREFFSPFGIYKKRKTFFKKQINY
ncbi:MAG: trimeric intracellular cation channel family protein [Patescibacteria group bacterium]|nr:trimeric intracellular cation channel family protein [Patescibacteria group bacterium]MDD5294637.1 trimeric intracellular cation channel family protein [Patescibacteria group bacterium]MDD5554546.1 trimeric intracellular cation channel family protein [Patescibacteria group bacterium]